MRKLAIFALAAVATGANAALLYSNGAVIDATSPAGNPINAMPSGNTTFGLAVSGDNGFRAADNFTVTGPMWIVNSIDLYAYQTQSTPQGYTFTTVSFDIVSGDVNTGTVVASGSNINSVNGGFMGYRVLNTTASNANNTTRPIYRVSVTGLNFNLNPGSYWLRYSINGTLSTGPFAVPVVPFTYTNGNAQIDNAGTGTFVTARDALSQRAWEIPFEMRGTAVPEPATMIALGAGIAAIAARRRRK